MRDSRGKRQPEVGNYNSYTTTVVSHYLGVGGVEWYGTIRRLGNPIPLVDGNGWEPGWYQVGRERG